MKQLHTVETYKTNGFQHDKMMFLADRQNVYSLSEDVLSQN